MRGEDDSVGSAYGDLHVHSSASDGTQTVSELALEARASGVGILALTDHDAVPPEILDRWSRLDGVGLLAGVEVKVSFHGVHGELLGYGIDPRHASLRVLLEARQEERRERLLAMRALCAQHLELDPETEDGERLTGSQTMSLGRPHLARWLAARGAVATEREAFDLYIGKGRPCHIPLSRPQAGEVAEVLREAGGVIALAHPCLMRVPDWRSFLGRLRDAGVDAIEAFYPYLHAHTDLTIDPAQMHALAEDAGFLLTGGSDHHGPGSARDTLGEVRVLPRHVAALLRACGVGGGDHGRGGLP
ncbi:MAG: PHP domain-containing protein [Candidatus Bipolaricaulota bacterium]|nr:MAG: PHP domain-containing protein [Candidatus Bipolaricaulota bacterium]